MSRNYIYCYSGSGNCLDIAKTIAGELGDTDIIMMRRRPEITDVRDAKTVGFVFPCYAGGLPGDVEKYVRQLSVSFSTYTYGVVSYAGYRGIGLSRINKAVPLNYWAGISHQCSCIWLFPHGLMLPLLSAEKAQKRSEMLARKIAEDVKNEVKILKDVPAPLFNKIESKFWPELSARKAEDLCVNIQKCVSCGRCERICPKDNIKITGKFPAFGNNCIGCLSCLQYCPQQAIDIGKVSMKRKRYHNPNVSAEELMKGIIHID